ncbi:hypothetical protein QF205_03540 [Luteimonas composti]|uniref:Uncharacterized protein n=1 Tax=Luteimonas composti TaxID=398257 RepID=A0ABT6MP92_9GAMM|nr:hypothetical protein [Luteimonas composti]MDH7452155.1 hypothetical protein [Luteimonas composti]
MSTRAMGPATGWSWLARALNLGRGNPKAVIGAIAVVALLAVLPSVMQMILQPRLGGQPTALLTVAGLSTLASLIVFPLLIGGVLRVIDAVERGRPASVGGVFEPFRAGHGAGRLVGFGLLMTALYLLVFGTIVGSFGQDLPEWYMQLVQLTVDAGGKPVQPDDIPAPPPGLGMVMALGLLFGLFLGGAYAIGFGQVALGGRGVLAAIGDGLAGALKNLLPIVVMSALAIVALLALTLVVTLVGGVLMLVGGLVHPALGALLVAPVYLGMILLMYVVMFGVMYHMWRDICAEPVAPPPLPDHLVEL